MDLGSHTYVYYCVLYYTDNLTYTFILVYAQTTVYCNLIYGQLGPPPKEGGSPASTQGIPCYVFIFGLFLPGVLLRGFKYFFQLTFMGLCQTRHRLQIILTVMDELSLGCV